MQAWNWLDAKPNSFVIYDSAVYPRDIKPINPPLINTRTPEGN